MEEDWRLIIDGAREPEMNMALDEAVMLCMAEEVSAPTLRVYRWLSPCVSVGRFQDPLTLPFSFKGEGDDNLPIIRRPTGGGAVFHDDHGFTYSLIYRESSGVIPKGVSASYREIHKAVSAALKELGIEVEFYSPVSKCTGQGGACFVSPVEYDVISNGKKVAGAAQRRKFGIVLHQGEVSLPLDVWHNQLYNNVLNKFINSLSRQLQAKFLEGQISEKEKGLAEELFMERKNIIEEVNR